MNSEFNSLEREDVVSVYSSQIFVNNRTFTINEFISAMMPTIKDKSGTTWTEEKANWFGEGIECKVLKPGAKSWQRGKVRITLEFCPEDLEIKDNNESPVISDNSPLDDIRQMMPKNGQ
ncbi:KGK family protein [Gloeocapsopsis crepidinum LEGE 06123]|uniref:KGK family protein n=1 Tax=Gloeocapsopsis crepidinum LEGE 06123 TaxID=588587 RepID=A0ABR9UPQ8_9CHRO|nr:KGK domain-containing protein [Gloeocapsopsis crepidinum]MBE9190259.1 KGK family protein [Gloeocapsopsis crepidinum LEGE 06123]